MAFSVEKIAFHFGQLAGGLCFCLAAGIILLVSVFAAAAQPVVPTDGQNFTTNATLAPGTYYLPNGIAVGASGVTIDLNGATLVGTNFNNYGVTSVGHDNVVIRNGTVHGYYYGVRIESGTNIQILDNNLSSNWVDPNSQATNPPGLNINAPPNLADRANLGGGLFALNVTGALVSNNVMRFEENGMDLFNVLGSTIIGNDTSDNTGWGIHLNACRTNRVSFNTADRCTRTGLYDSAGFLLVVGSSGNQILSNSFQYSGDGFFLGNEHGCPSDGNLVQGNNGSYAGANAFEATFSSGNQFIGNNANFSAYGFWLGYSHDGNIIRSNTIRANNNSGIEIEHGQNNTIEGNDILGNGGSGIVLRTDGLEHFGSNACFDLPNQAASSGYTIRNNRIIGNFGTGMVLTLTSNSLIYNNLFGGPYAPTVTSAVSNNVWSISPMPGTNIVGGPMLGGNWWYGYPGSDTNADGLGDTAVPYTNGGQVAPPGDPHPLIGSPDLGNLANPHSMSDYFWIDLGRNTRTIGGTFDTANGTHFASDGTNLFLLEGDNSPSLFRFDPNTSRYIPKASAPEAVQDGGDFQFGGGLYYATLGLGFDTTTGAGNGSRLYTYNQVTDTWSSKTPTSINGHLVCNEALAFDNMSNRLYATIVNVLSPASGGDPTMLSKLAVYLPASNAWTGVTTAASDTWSPGSEAEYLDGSIYVWRGGFAGGAVNGSDSYLDVYSIASNSWSRTPSLLNCGVTPGFRAGGFDVWGISLSADPIHHRLFVIGAESNHQLYIFDLASQTWTVGPAAPYDGGWGASLEYVSAADRLYQIDGRNSTAAPQGSAVLLRFNLSAKFQSPASIDLTWPAAAGHNYQVQFKTNLTQPGWLNLGVAVTATNSAMTTTDAIGQLAQRYYRVLFQP